MNSVGLRVLYARAVFAHDFFLQVKCRFIDSLLYIVYYANVNIFLFLPTFGQCNNAISLQMVFIHFLYISIQSSTIFGVLVKFKVVIVQIIASNQVLNERPCYFSSYYLVPCALAH